MFNDVKAGGYIGELINQSIYQFLVWPK